MSVAEHVAAIRARIEAAARAAGRAPQDVTLVAVCKRQPFERILAAYQAGLRQFGESTAQGLRATAERFAAQGCGDVRWHFIGALQRNKVNQVLPHRPWIHSIDRPALARAISDRAQQDVDVLVEVNLGGEASKAGVPHSEALELCGQVASLPRLRLRGLMTLPPQDQDPRPFFDQLRELSEQLPPEARELSMGMSGDFETAIACGATLVRVGTDLFGPRLERP